MEMCSLAHAVTWYAQDLKQGHVNCHDIQLAAVHLPPPQTLLQRPARPTHCSVSHQALWCACCSAFAAWAALASPAVSGTASGSLLCVLASAWCHLLLAASCIVSRYAAAWQVHLAGMAHAASAGFCHGLSNQLS